VVVEESAQLVEAGGSRCLYSLAQSVAEDILMKGLVVGIGKEGGEVVSGVVGHRWVPTRFPIHRDTKR
jgi:hypothetical protein